MLLNGAHDFAEKIMFRPSLNFNRKVTPENECVCFQLQNVCKICTMPSKRHNNNYYSVIIFLSSFTNSADSV